MFKEIVVPLDLNRRSDAALAAAADIARRARAPMRVVTVSSPGLDRTEDRYALTEIAAGIQAPMVAAEVLASNDVVNALVETSRPEGLLVVQTHARGPLAAAVLGTTTNALLRATPRPVLLVGPHADTSKPALLMDVCVDTLEAAESLVPIAGAWAQSLGLRLRFVHVEARQDAAQPELEGLAERAARRAAEAFHVPSGGVALHGRSATEAIAADARDVGAGIVAVGMRHRPSPLRIALGSVAVAVAHASHAAVLAIPVGVREEVVAA